MAEHEGPETKPEAAANAELGSEAESRSPVSEPEPSSPSESRRLITIAPGLGKPPSSHLAQKDAIAIWAAATSPWHPALLARIDAPPRLESTESPEPPDRLDIRMAARGSLYRLSSGYSTQAADSGSILLEGERDRDECVRQWMAALDPSGMADLEPDDRKGLSLVSDFFAMGWAHYWLHELTIAMSHPDILDRESFSREVILAAQAWLRGDWPTATNRLRAAFEVMTQARERFYPMDSYIVDLCLLDPSTSPGDALALLEERTAVTFLATGRAIETLAAHGPELMEAVRKGVADGWIDLIGGAYAEAEEGLLPLESILWQFRRARRSYRANLDDRDVETLARRRFGLYPQLPQVAQKYGFRFGLHLCFDSGRFPTRPEIKKLWDSPDGSSLETIHRVPLAANLAIDGLRLPWLMADSMNEDQAGTILLARWPAPVAPWLADARRTSAFAPVIGRWVTMGDYFHYTDRPYESLHASLDEYETPYLEQAVRRGDPAPISRRARHARLRSLCDGANWLRSMTLALGGPSAAIASDDQIPDLEQALETGKHDEAEAGLRAASDPWASALAGRLGPFAANGKPGFLVFNPASVHRQVPVLLPEAAADLRPSGPLRAAQFTEEGTWAVADLPPLGFAWLPKETDLDVPPAPTGVLSFRDLTLSNSLIEAEIDAKTGGLRSVRSKGEPSARLAQQLTALGVVDPHGEPANSVMRCDSHDVDYAGPALVQAWTQGRILDPQGAVLAKFRQQFRLWAARSILEIEIAISELDQAWLDRIGGLSADPWREALACRWAWPDSQAIIRRTSLHGAYPTSTLRPETSEAFEILARSRQTALLFGGLAYHQRHGSRMLDTLLIAGKESARVFRLAVVLDREHLSAAAQDWLAPVPVALIESGPPVAGSQGWLIQVDHPAVAVTRVDYLPASDEGRGWGLGIHLIETSGYPVRCKVRTFRNPASARQTDYQDNLVMELSIDGDSALVDLTPYEMTRLEVTLG